MESKLVVRARVMPARRGRPVLAVLQRKQLVGLHSLLNGAQANFVRSDPPLLWRRSDGLTVVLIGAAAAGQVTAHWGLGDATDEAAAV